MVLTETKTFIKKPNALVFSYLQLLWFHPCLQSDFSIVLRSETLKGEAILYFFFVGLLLFLNESTV